MTSVPYTAEMADFAANFTFESLPSTFVALLSIFTLDTLAVMLAGMVQPVYRSALEATTFLHSGNGTYTTLDGTHISLSGQMYMMGLTTGDFEFDHVIEGSHPSSSVFPALLCVAAAYHKSGRDLLSAMAIGYEYAARIGYAIGGEDAEEETGFHTMINGAPATAAAVGNLMGWDADLIASAMGLAASSSSGLYAWINTEAMTRRTHPASMGQLGAEAALLAKAGVVGPRNIMENRYGYLNAFSVDPRPDALVEGLGVKWESTEQTLKVLPVHARALGFAHAVNLYRQKHTWSALDVDNITIYAGPPVLDPRNWILEPQSLSTAQYSIPFGIVASIVADLRNPLNMNDALVLNKTARDLTSSIRGVSITDDPEYFLGYMTMNIGDELVNITVDGYPGLPGSDDYQQAAEDKYLAVVESLDLGENADKVKDTIMKLSECDDVSVMLDDLIELGKAGTGNFFAQK
jgi:2-methylcitrate dehydratase PrpD